jgi:hypothetical protein
MDAMHRMCVSNEYQLGIGVDKMYETAANDIHPVLTRRERLQNLADENVKLRELLSGVGYLLFALDVDYCVACPRDSISHPCPVYTIKGGECLYKRDMRELGIDVD